MHKKSIEAADKLKNEPGIDEMLHEPLKDDYRVSMHAEDSPDNNNTLPAVRDREELRSESIASLRAKAQTYSAQLRDAVHSDVIAARRELCSSFDTPSSHENEDSDTILDPTN